ncbi:hypothetical protein K2P56_04195 [Patescibacteria group bacterium]|nr:hypothetical protein [Patescibacteria group bacterium]
MEHADPKGEELAHTLKDEAELLAFKSKYDGYKPGIVPRILGSLLVFCGDAVYGKKPSYLKFRAVEVIARIPYHSWESAAFTLLTLFFMNEKKALALSNVSWFARMASDNETMHVVVISQLAHKAGGGNWFVHTLIPMVFAFFYFWAAYWLYLFSHKAAFELNYLFEQHAFDQYSEFLKTNEADLKSKKMESDYLAWYGRKAETEYDFFMLVRNDEIIHRNNSIAHIEERAAMKAG